MKKFGSSFFVTGTLGDRWVSALKDPAFYIAAFIVVVLAILIL